MTSNLFKLGVIIGATNNTGSAFGRLDSSINSIDQKSKRLSNRFSSLVNFRNAGLVLATTQFLKAGAQLEQTKISFQTLLGDETAGNALVESINELANRTPYMNNQLLKSAEVMLSFGISQKEILPYISVLGDVASGNGDKLRSLTLAFSQMRTAGKLLGQDLRQMTELGFNPLTQIAKDTGKSLTYWQDQQQKGNVSAEMTTKAFMRATQEGGRFFNMMEKQSLTAAGRWSTLMGKMQYGVSKASLGLMPAMTNVLGVAIPMIDVISGIAQNHEGLTTAVLGTGVALTSLYIGSKVYGVMSASVSLAASGINLASIRLVRMGRVLRVVTARQLGLNVAVLANPYVIATTAVVALGAALWYFGSAASAANDKMKIQTSIRKEAIGRIKEEYGEFRYLMQQLQRTNVTQERKSEVIDTLNTKYGKYVSNINLATASHKELNGAMHIGLEEMTKQIKMQMTKDRLKKILGVVVDAELEMKAIIDKYGGNKPERRMSAGRFELDDVREQNKDVKKIKKLELKIKEENKKIKTYEGLLSDIGGKKNVTITQDNRVTVQGNADTKTVKDIQQSQERNLSFR